MAWHDDSRQNQQKWLSHMARERLDLSASVEATLESDALQEQPWLDEAEEKGSSPSHSAQNTNVLMRLAQRLTSPFVALGPSKHSSDVGEASQQPSETLRVLPRPLGYEREADPIEGNVEAPKASAICTFPVLSDRVESSSQVQSRQRLAGHTTKIRLQTAPNLAVPRSVQPGVGKSLREEAQEIEMVDEHVMENMHKHASSTSSHLPIVMAMARGILFGSGVLKSGQSEVTIANAQVASSSVVQVMLTTYPGPVVVQYVSLQPHKGFTVHLTAPTTVDATFNYMIFLRESC